MNINKIKSPVTQNFNVSIDKILNSNIIIRDYKRKLNIDVSNFFTEDLCYILKCNDTGYKFYYPFSLVGNDKFYEDLQNGKSYYPGNKKEYDIAFDKIKSLGIGQKILDIGCGNGTFLSKFNNIEFELFGLEFNDVSVEKCKKLNLNVVKESIEKHSLNNENKYDVVCFFQVLEHVPNVSSFLNAAINCLKKDGFLIIAVPNNEPYFAKYHLYSTSNLPPHHMGLWNFDSLNALRSYYPIDLLEESYDMPIKWYYLIFVKSKLQIHNWFPNLVNSNIVLILTVILSIFNFPIIFFYSKFINSKIISGRIITIFKKR
jgi:2-polyprenyl-3-methyl-5-hydroxy-6-metoxy-1,4-benzoquinol methylase